MDTIERRRSGRDGHQSRGGIFDRRRIVASADFNRWLVPPAALAIHLSIGMAYGFSVFWLPLSKALPGAEACSANMSWLDELTASCNWRIESLNITFILFTVVLGVAAAVWGNWVERVGPRKAAAVSALFWCSGLSLGALAIHIHQLWLLWLGTGVIGGIGLGLGYISPISILIRWFPDRRGMATGMAVMGFGGGAMIGAPLAVLLMKHFQTAADPGVSATFLCLAAIYAVFMLGGAFGYRLPARGWQPAGWTPPTGGSGAHTHSVHVTEAWKTPTFWFMWGVLCMNISAGIGVLSMASPLLQEIFGGRLIGLDIDFEHLSAAERTQIAIAGVGFTGLLSLFNISGRFVWAVLSDRIGRKNTFYCYFLIGIPLYAALPTMAATGHVALFVASFCVLMSIFGGGYAVIPSYLSDMFGTEMVGAIQGRVMTAWSVAGVIGPFMISALRNFQFEHGMPLAKAYDVAFYLLAALLVVGMICNSLVRPVGEKHFMTVEELEKHRMVTRSDITDAPSGLVTVSMPSALTVTLAGVWLAVCLPIAWGVLITLQRVSALLNQVKSIIIM